MLRVDQVIGSNRVAAQMHSFQPKMKITYIVAKIIMFRFKVVGRLKKSFEDHATNENGWLYSGQLSDFSPKIFYFIGDFCY